MGEFGIGQAVRRVEDEALLVGRGAFTADIALAGEAYAHIVRSPHAHARIVGLDRSAALAAPGVIAVITARDIAPDGINALPPQARLDMLGTPQAETPREVLASECVRYVGEPVAFVVAETAQIAREAAERVAADYETRPAVSSLKESARPDAPRIWAHIPENRCFDFRLGDEGEVATAFAHAAHVTECELVMSRVVPNPMEPRAAIGSYDAATDLYTIQTPTQGAWAFANRISQILKVPREKIRCLTPHVGGGFGMKSKVYAEQVLVLWAARRFGRPIKWVGARAEAFQSDTHARDVVSRAAAAFDSRGRILALRFHNRANLGAYVSQAGALIATMGGGRVLGSVYRVPRLFYRVEGILTNTVPVDSYRGAGRPEAAFFMERLLDIAAREMGLAPDEIRSRNVLAPGDFPHRNAVGSVYDSGEPGAVLAKALTLGDWEGFSSRRAAARARGRLRGIGIGSYIEVTANQPQEYARIAFRPNGGIEVRLGTQDNGQGHATTFAQIVSDRLGVPFEAVCVREGDSAATPVGGGSFGSRSAHIGGEAILRAVETVIEKGRHVAAHLLEAAPTDIAFADGRFTIVGTDRTLDIMDVARAARSDDMPDGVLAEPPDGETGLDSGHAHTAEASTYPNGAHICELEVDPETGAVTIERYAVVDDVGTVINPMIVEGQIQGGIAQGLGQALIETIAYEPGSGQLLTGSFMDYGMPRASDLVTIESAFHPVPCRTNALGVKGCGEGGACGAGPAIHNALMNALEDYGLASLPMPATPFALWQAMQEARARGPAPVRGNADHAAMIREETP